MRDVLKAHILVVGDAVNDELSNLPEDPVAGIIVTKRDDMKSVKVCQAR